MSATQTHDVTFAAGAFSAWNFKVTAETPAARALFGEMFGAGAVSVDMPKSRAVDFARFVAQRGLTHD